MKNRIRILVAALIIGFEFISCSLFTNEEESSLIITFNGADFARSAGRNVTVGPDYSGYYLTANLWGDYTDCKEIPFNSTGSYNLTFTSVPVGAEVYIEVNVFDPTAEEFTHLYRGETEKRWITSGQNRVNLSMKSLVKDISIGNYYDDVTTRNYGMMHAYIEGAMVEANLYFFNNGKMLLQYSQYNPEGVLDRFVLSEGIWSGNENAFSDGGIIQVKEYLYRPYKLLLDENENLTVKFEEAIIATDSQITNIVFEKDEYVADPTFSFTSRNGLTFIQEH